MRNVSLVKIHKRYDMPAEKMSRRFVFVVNSLLKANIESRKNNNDNWFWWRHISPNAGKKEGFTLKNSVQNRETNLLNKFVNK